MLQAFVRFQAWVPHNTTFLWDIFLIVVIRHSNAAVLRIAVSFLLLLDFVELVKKVSGLLLFFSQNLSFKFNPI
jgi:hypothetical protein